MIGVETRALGGATGPEGMPTMHMATLRIQRSQEILDQLDSWEFLLEDAIEQMYLDDARLEVAQEQREEEGRQTEHRERKERESETSRLLAEIEIEQIMLSDMELPDKLFRCDEILFALPEENSVRHRNFMRQIRDKVTAFAKGRYTAMPTGRGAPGAQETSTELAEEEDSKLDSKEDEVTIFRSATQTMRESLREHHASTYLTDPSTTTKCADCIIVGLDLEPCLGMRVKPLKADQNNPSSRAGMIVSVSSDKDAVFVLWEHRPEPCGWYKCGHLREYSLRSLLETEATHFQLINPTKTGGNSKEEIEERWSFYSADNQVTTNLLDHLTSWI
ncbi:hypothetical protein GUITHDRAFT_147106 [Guillardia theta CCMP2712]|uniref:Uncharacterized protein n=1 Tax=Guillardia theta (strain CCMP2712) TaxID=905079 RepID=L1IF96_GUITC|nr:hypothetical protein GUITHDRAFT_147106 [Guillardia theta CCMP2712]EKX34584.1 hypothetical protein GUITHDRAFT_147106 [Guillardia theta CCMP2712]|eukprot:XP_005821564.1 hypothetical protein GUITHDRAFT_147106 [Guillardia theta CCMP2712]